MPKPRIKIGRETCRGLYFMSRAGAVDYSFNVEINGKKLEVTLLQTAKGKFLKSTFTHRYSGEKVNVSRAIAVKIMNELIGSRI